MQTKILVRPNDAGDVWKKKKDPRYDGIHDKGIRQPSNNPKGLSQGNITRSGGNAKQDIDLAQFSNIGEIKDWSAFDKAHGIGIPSIPDPRRRYKK